MLNDGQYEHIKEVLKRLADFGDKDKLSDLSIEPIRSFWELREKGGILGRINLRVYFGAFRDEGEIVIARTYKKEDEGKTPAHIVEHVEHRLEAYRNGGRRKSDSVHDRVVLPK